MKNDGKWVEENCLPFSGLARILARNLNSMHQIWYQSIAEKRTFHLKKTPFDYLFSSENESIDLLIFLRDIEVGRP